MEIAKLAVAVLAGAIGGFAAAKLFGGKKTDDDHVVLKVWGAHTDKPCIEVPMRPVKGGWMGGTPCAENAFTMSRIDRKTYDSLVERLKQAYEAGPSRSPEEVDAEADAAIEAERAGEVRAEADPAEEAEELEVEVAEA